MREEEARRKKVGSMDYYKEWVKAWREDTSKAAVQEKAKRTGKGVVDQLLDMMQQQSLREYRKMQGTDVRIRRAPLTMRMTEEEIKQGMSRHISWILSLATTCVYCAVTHLITI